MAYALSQTFYLDPNALNNATSCFLTSFTVYFKTKPSGTNNVSGMADPMVHLAISETNADGTPNVDVFFPFTLVQKSASQITANATSLVATTFTFDHPMPLKTGKRYAANFMFADSAFQIWYAKKNDKLIGTANTLFGGFGGGFQGQVFDYGTSGTITPRVDTQLSFNLQVAKFTANTVTYDLINKDFEFFAVSNQSSAEFIGGETAFKLGANATGNAILVAGNTTITGVGTTFNAGNFTSNTTIVFYSNSTNMFARQVVSVANATSMVVDEAIPLSFANSTGSKFFKAPSGKVYNTSTAAGTLYLKSSNANTTLYFANGDTVVGAISGAQAYIDVVKAVPVTSVQGRLGIDTPSGGNVSLTVAFAYSNGSVYKFDTPNFQNIDNLKETLITDYNALLLSKSIEVNNSTYLYSANAKSGVYKITITQDGTVANGIYTSPYIFSEQLDVYTSYNNINNDYTNETKKYGNAYAKHITTKINFDAGKFAEDLFVYTTAYKPVGTDIRAYAKLRNSKDPETFDEKDWTPLVALNNSNAAASAVTSSDYYDYTFGLPSAPVSVSTLGGTVTTTLSSSTITGSNTAFSSALYVNDVIKIYSPLFPTTYQVSVVQSIANDTSIVINDLISNSSMVSSGLLVDRIGNTTYTAFINPQNSNVARYYNSTAMQFDSYDTVQVKMVLLSNNINISPRLSDLRVIGVSA